MQPFLGDGQIICCPSGQVWAGGNYCCPGAPSTVSVLTNGMCAIEQKCATSKSGYCQTSTGVPAVSEPNEACPGGFTVFEDVGPPICAQCPAGSSFVDSAGKCVANSVATPPPPPPYVPPVRLCSRGTEKAADGSCCPDARLTSKGLCCPAGVRPQGDGSCSPLPPVGQPNPAPSLGNVEHRFSGCVAPSVFRDGHCLILHLPIKVDATGRPPPPRVFIPRFTPRRAPPPRPSPGRTRCFHGRC